MLTNNVLKAATGSLLAASMLMTAMPASAQYRGDRHRDRDGISAGEIIAGAVVVGGLAAILSNNGRGDRYYDRVDNRYYNSWDHDYRRGGNSRQAIEQCVYAVEGRGGRRDDVDVRRITDVERIRGGYRVEGRVAVDYRGGYRGDRWDRGERDYRGGGYGRQRYDDRGRFTCIVRYGRVQDVDFRGI
jgi:hypothetical protein